MYNHSNHEISSSAENGPPTENHEEVTGQSVRESDEETELPTRVLDVGSPNLYLHCHEGEENRPKGKYITLSHCWGADPNQRPLRTTDNNIDAHRQGKGLEFDRLPKTFQDAITVARKLDVQYLWIDSLCIIQGNSEDWEKESRKMEGIFSSAYCTIAATSAKNSDEGFLPFPKKKAVRIGEIFRSSVYACIAEKSFKQAVDESGLLNTRGWVLQERALSRRTIHFTGSQIFWECGSMIFYDNLFQVAR